MRKWITLLLLVVMLTACGEEPEEVYVEPPPPPKHEVVEQVVWNDLTLTGITKTSSIEVTNDIVKVFPYNDSDLYIQIEKYYFSGNRLFEKFIMSSDKADVKMVNDIMCCAGNGTTYVFVPATEDYAYLVSTTMLADYGMWTANMLWQALHVS